MEWLQLILTLAVPPTLGAMWWLITENSKMKTALAVHNRRLEAVETGMQENKRMGERLATIETTMPFMSQALQRIENVMKELTNTVHRVEVNVAGNGERGRVE